jgi:hypothetical protein
MLWLSSIIIVLFSIVTPSWSDEAISCASLKDLEYGKLVAFDAARKQTEGMFQSMPVNIIQPYAGQWFKGHQADEDFVDKYIEQFDNEKRQSMSARDSVFPHYYGMYIYMK